MQIKQWPLSVQHSVPLQKAGLESFSKAYPTRMKHCPRLHTKPERISVHKLQRLIHAIVVLGERQVDEFESSLSRLMDLCSQCVIVVSQSDCVVQ